MPGSRGGVGSGVGRDGVEVGSMVELCADVLEISKVDADNENEETDTDSVGLGEIVVVTSVTNVNVLTTGVDVVA